MPASVSRPSIHFSTMHGQCLSPVFLALHFTSLPSLRFVSAESASRRVPGLGERWAPGPDLQRRRRRVCTGVSSRFARLRRAYLPPDPAVQGLTASYGCFLSWLVHRQRAVDFVYELHRPAGLAPVDGALHCPVRSVTAGFDFSRVLTASQLHAMWLHSFTRNEL